MSEPFLRTEMLLGSENMQKLKNANVIVFGIGGVGTFATEGLVRAGVGNISLVDYDTIDISNLNRQLIATVENIGQPKVFEMKERILKINPECNVKTFQMEYNKENRDLLLNDSYDYVVDAIDIITHKIDLIISSQKLGLKIISSMGTGNKLNPAQLEISDIYKTRVCPLARVLRKELRLRGVKELKVVYSEEQPLKANQDLLAGGSTRRSTPGSTSFVPSVSGLLLCSEVIKDLTK